ncbi:Hypothetical predicted protein [Octopus vulgaris]|uniref:Uncharacterized protein n=1 Tax=Octopus vulgaris TaxID=6645 RepID=A0AA36B773_OCTVU|nr:Hypothetical predicted protein [Octopus vulgaris]
MDTTPLSRAKFFCGKISYALHYLVYLEAGLQKCSSTYGLVSGIWGSMYAFGYFPTILLEEILAKEKVFLLSEHTRFHTHGEMEESNSCEC